jgi:uncharacterized protein (DUF488 family)
MPGGRQKVVTIGAYGFNEESFLQALQDAGVDTFCDIRLRRGMRGANYAFANAARLQRRLNDLGIRYLHLKHLAPSQTIRDKQRQHDAKHGVGKQSRQTLSPDFVHAYTEQCLSNFDSGKFVEDLGTEVQTLALFCVEGEPNACHRSLVANRLAKDLELQVEHKKPWMS